MLELARQHSLKVKQHILFNASILGQRKAVLSTTSRLLVHLG